MTTIETTGAGRGDLGHANDRKVGAARLAIGLLQGIALYLLFRTAEGSSDVNWSSRHPETFGPLVLTALFLPPVLLAGVGRLRWLTLAIWGVIAAAALAFLAWHDVDRQAGDVGRQLTPPLFAFAAAALFIAHHLIVPADRERRPLASYTAYFDAAWMAGVQLVLSIAFAGAFWLLLFLGAALFKIIGLNFLGDLIDKGWFSFPLTGLAFATAVHLTDVRDGLIRGVRTIALMLLSWLLLVLTVLVGGFLAALPFTGLDGLWQTGSATALVLAAAGGTIILINAAYQDGREDNLPPVVLRVAVRVASVLLTPLVIIAVWGLSLRIGQHGLTPDRIIAAACALVGAGYAVGYGLGALVPFVRKGSPWMKALETTNIVTAVLAVAVILALFTPLADPARLSVADQMARLENGKVAADKFDYAFLQNSSGKTGRAALARLAASDDADIARRAKEAQADAYVTDPLADADFKPTIGVLAGAPALPEAFFQIVGGPNDARLACRADDDCLAVLGPSVGFPQGDILLVQAEVVTLFSEDAEYGTYWPQGFFSPVVCAGQTAVDARELLRQGRLKAGQNDRPALDTGSGVASQLVARPSPEC